MSCLLKKCEVKIGKQMEKKEVRREWGEEGLVEEAGEIGGVKRAEGVEKWLKQM